MLRYLRLIRRSLDFDAAHALIRAFIHSRLDYCNICAGLSARTITDSPELVCSSSPPAARSGKCINPDAQRSLHRAALAMFPTADHIQTVPADFQSAPRWSGSAVYLVRRCVRVSSDAGRARLRSASTGQLVVPRTSKKIFGDWAFASSGPISWNCLSSLVRDDCLHAPLFQETLETAPIFLVSSARNLGIIFDSNLSFSDHISYISKSCFSHIRDLRRIRNTLDHKTACTIATSLIHSKLDYCNSLYLNISNQQLNWLQLILNSAARAVTKTPKFHHITPHLKSLHWLKITQRIQYKILSLTYKSLQYNEPSSISDLLTIQPTRSTRSSAVVTLQRPSNPSRLKISDRSFYFQAPALWNALPHHLRSHSHSSQSHSLLSLSSSQFHKQLKTHLFLHSYPP